MYLFGLAERLHMTLCQLCNSITSDEISEWLAYDQVKPLNADDYRYAKLHHAIVSVPYAFGDRPPPPLKVFLPERAQVAKPPMSSADMRAALMASCAHLRSKPYGSDR